MEEADHHSDRNNKHTDASVSGDDDGSASGDGAASENSGTQVSSVGEGRCEAPRCGRASSLRAIAVEDLRRMGARLEPQGAAALEGPAK